MQLVGENGRWQIIIFLFTWIEGALIGCHHLSSVFLGASSSKASPHILLLLRSVKRELTICEHRASDARFSRAVFSPNSTRMAFQTDRHEKIVIYSMAVERLIERTEENTN